MANKYNRLVHSRVLILGGTSGIGFCVAEAALEHDAYVTISSSRQAKLDSALDRLKSAYPDGASRVGGHVCDLSQPKVVEANLETLFQAAAKDAPIDHVVFTAGDAVKVVPVSDVTLDDILKCGQVRFIAPLLLAKIAPKYMSAGPDSSITLTSGVNSTKPMKNWALIAAWGAGVEGMTKGLAVDLAPRRVNAISPGAVHTELFSDIPQERLPSVLERFEEATLTERVGRPEDLAQAYVYAMKDRFVTGTLIHSNGGSLLK